MDGNNEQFINLSENILQNSSQLSKNPSIYGNSDDSIKGYKSTILNCSQIVGYNNAVGVIRYELEIINIENTEAVSIFVSEALSEWQTMKVNLDTLNIIPGTELYLKAVPNVRHEEYVLERIIYTPNSNTVYFEYIHEGIGYYPEYRGMVKSPLSPPVLKCSSVTVYNDSKQWTKYELRLPNSGSALYSSGRCRLNSTWTLNLLNLSILPGTPFILHAGVIAGADCDGYVVIEYDPTITTASTAKFTLVGNAFYTGLFFEGVN